MAKVNVENVTVLDNPSDFLNPFQFEITFECIENLPNDLEWKLTYVGSAESESHDQVLDTVLVGPVPEGRHKFVFQADPPNPALIPKNEVVGVTVVLLSCSYNDKEFIKIGYFVGIEYEDPELKESPPEAPVFEKLKRNLLADEPRVTRINIPWDKDGEDATSAEEGGESMEETPSGSGENTENLVPPSEPICNGSGDSSDLSGKTLDTAKADPLATSNGQGDAAAPMEA